MKNCRIIRTHFRSRLIVLVLFLVAVGLGAQDVSFPGEGRPGEVVVIKTDEPVEEVVSVTLFDKERQKITAARAFEMDGETRIFLALPSTIEPGRYTLSASGMQSSLHRGKPFTVYPREFLSERIDLDDALTDLRTSDDERIRTEALEIQALYALFNPQADYSAFSFEAPLPFEHLEYFRISSEYGDRRIYHYSDDRQSRSIHAGIDMAAREGTPVLAAGSGRVVLAKDRYISGKSVVIEHLPGVYSVYFHLSDIAVSVGDFVREKQRIGRVGRTGLATGPHLHWEIRVNGTAVDPRLLTQEAIPDKIQSTSSEE